MSFTYDNLRTKYPQFIYDSYSVERNADELKVIYNFEIPGLAQFSPDLTFPLNEMTVNDPESELGQRILFSIGLVELISYWKIACPPEVIIKAGHLSAEQIQWWKKLYFNGLGEFFYKNSIEAKFADFMNISSASQEIGSFSNNFISKNLNLLPVGGGKDSIVTVEHLKTYKDKNVTFALNPTLAAQNTMKIAASYGTKSYIVSRRLDQEMLRLNKAGYLNGHTPFSALLAFVAYYVSYLIGADYIILSNEASANAATIPGTEINHQYSKTSEFELAFQAYTREYFSENIYYFSLLRPFAELAIAKSFSQYEQYFPYFRSCNRGSKQNIWCGKCPKCLFVYAVLAPFIEPDKLQNIFGKDLWSEELLLEDWEKLLGIWEQKPFECVGTVEEVQYASFLVINQLLSAGKKDLPLLLQRVVTASQAGELSELAWDERQGKLLSLAKTNPLQVWHKDERVPEQFKALITDILA